MKKQLQEGMASINVEEEIDISRIKKLAGLANSTTAAGTPVTESADEHDLTPEQAEQVADALEDVLEQMNSALEQAEHIVRQYLPNMYRSMEAYTFAHIKTSLGGHGYADRMSTSIADLIEDLREESGEDY